MQTQPGQKRSHSQKLVRHWWVRHQAFFELNQYTYVFHKPSDTSQLARHLAVTHKCSNTEWAPNVQQLPPCNKRLKSVRGKQNHRIKEQSFSSSIRRKMWALRPITCTRHANRHLPRVHPCDSNQNGTFSFKMGRPFFCFREYYRLTRIFKHAQWHIIMHLELYWHVR